MKDLEGYTERAEELAEVFADQFKNQKEAISFAYARGFEDAIHVISDTIESSCKEAGNTQTTLKQTLTFIAEVIRRTVDYEKAVVERKDLTEAGMN